MKRKEKHYRQKPKLIQNNLKYFRYPSRVRRKFQKVMLRHKQKRLLSKHQIVKENIETPATQTEEKIAEANPIEPLKQTSCQIEKPLAINEGSAQEIEVPIQEETREVTETTNAPSVVEAIEEEAEVETENQIPLNANIVNIAKYTDSFEASFADKSSSVHW